MVFKNILIKNFRGIKLLEIKDLGAVNLLGGKNNSGKTSILEALQILARPFDFEHYAQLNLAREYQKEDENMDLFFYELDKKNEILIQDSTNNKTIEILDNQLAFQKANQNSQKILIGFSKKDFFFHYAQRQLHFIHEKDKIENLKYNYPALSISTVFLHSTQNFLPDLSQQIKKMKIEKIIKRIVEVLHEVDPRIVEIDIFDEIIFIDIGLKRLIPIQLAGDGLKRILSIVVGMYQASGGVLLIDEVDVGLHYSVQETMWRAIWKAAKEFRVQVFATTHSTDCIEAFSQIAEQNQSQRSNYYRVDRLENEHKVVLYDKDLLETAVAHEFEIR